MDALHGVHPFFGFIAAGQVVSKPRLMHSFSKKFPNSFIDMGFM